MPYKLNIFTGQFDYYETGGAVVGSSNALLLETGDNILLESGDYLLLENN